MIEAMVVIAIAAILTALAVPSMRNLIESNGVSDSIDSLTGSIAFARAEAIKRGFPVAICSSEAAKTGTVACGAASTWSVGWIIFVDYEGNGALGTKDTVLRVQGSFEKNGGIANTAGSLVFKPTGTLSGIATSFGFKAPAEKDSDPPSKKVCVSSAGRVRVVNASEC